MKRILFLFLLLINCCLAVAQTGSLSQSVYKTRVNDTTSVAFQNALASAVASGYGYHFWNNQAATPHWDFYTESGVQHIFEFGAGGGGGGTVTSVSGTANRITSTGGTTPVIDISASYVGQSSITTTGTLTSGATGSGFTVALGTSTITGTLPNTNLSTAIRTKDFPFSVTDEVIPISTGNGVLKFRAPRAMTLTGVRASLNTAQASGSIVTVDINEGGSTILSTKLTFDNTETTTVTAVTAPVISDTSIADNAEITIDIDQADAATAAAGLKITLYYVD